MALRPISSATAMPPHILVTRPLPDACAWVAALRAHGHQAQALPLLAIQPRVPQLRGGCTSYRAVMFVSGHAVQHFFATPALLSALGGDARIWAPGPGTVRALLAHGIAPQRIDSPADDAAQFDSEALWSRVQGRIRPGDSVLIVRGDSSAASGNAAGTGRNWLAARLLERGARVACIAVYQRTLPVWSTAQQQAARRAASDGSLWVFSSAEAVANLQRLVPGQPWQQARALATHARIACAAARLGFGRVSACRPTLAQLLASIESLP